MDDFFKKITNSHIAVKSPIIIAMALAMAWFIALLFPSKMGAEIFGGVVADMYEDQIAQHRMFHPDEE